MQLLYSIATQRFSRGTVFNMSITGFLVFMGTFGLLYPSHEAMHLSGFADAANSLLPSGMCCYMPGSPAVLPVEMLTVSAFAGRICWSSGYGAELDVHLLLLLG